MYPKKEIDCKRLLIGYKSQIYTTNFTNILQKTTTIRHRLQSLLIYYKRLQTADIDYKVYARLQKTTDVRHRLQSLVIKYRILPLSTFSLQKFVVSTFFHYKIL